MQMMVIVRSRRILDYVVLVLSSSKFNTSIVDAADGRRTHFNHVIKTELGHNVSVNNIARFPCRFIIISDRLSIIDLAVRTV